MRTVKALKNVSSQAINLVIISVLNFIYRAFLVKYIGIEYVGLNAALLNIVALLSLTELGVSQAISYFLYKPLKNKDNLEIRTILKFLRKIYLIIGIVNIVMAMIMVLFIDDIIKLSGNITAENLVFFFLLYAISSIIPYFFSYKRILIIADQKNYEILPRITLIKFFDITIKVIILYFFKSYLFVLISQVFFVIIENIVVNRYIGIRYKNIFYNDNCHDISCSDKGDIIKKIKSMFFHKLGDLSLNSTDNIIINHFVGLSSLGVFSNYVMLTGLITTFISVLFNSITSSVGSLVTEKNKENINSFFVFVYKVSTFLFIYASVCFYFLSNDIISLWLNKSYFIDDSTKLLMSISLFLLGTRVPLNMLKMASGEVERDKLAPLIQACINLILSIFFAYYWGVKGVLLGTIVSNILVPMWVQPYIVYKYILNLNVKNYYFLFGKTISSAIICFITIYYLYDGIYSSYYGLMLNSCVNFILLLLIVILPSLLIMLIVLFNKADLYYIRNRLIR